MRKGYCKKVICRSSPLSEGLFSNGSSWWNDSIISLSNHTYQLVHWYTSSSINDVECHVEKLVCVTFHLTMSHPWPFVSFCYLTSFLICPESWSVTPLARSHAPYEKIPSESSWNGAMRRWMKCHSEQSFDHLRCWIAVFDGSFVNITPQSGF